MPSLENLKVILREVEALKNSDEYSLRIASTLANSALLRLEDPNVMASVVREVLSRIRGITKFYIEADSGLARIHEVLGLWHDRFFPGPRPMEENPADNETVFLENSNTNPITLPDGDSLPGSVVHMFTKERHLSREFAEEMEAALLDKNWTAKSEDDVTAYLIHAAAEVRMKGSVLHAPPRIVDRAKRVLRMKEIPYDRIPVAFGAILWVPKDSKAEAVQALREAGYTQEAPR